MTLGVLVQMALRSLWSHKVKSLIVGSLLAFGTVLLVVGSALLDSVETAMERSIVQSLTGHLQIYSADAKDDLAIFGGMSMGDDDIGELADFSRVKQVVAAVPNVEAVVPMGISTSQMTRGSELERALAELRAAVREGDVGRQKGLQPRIDRLLVLQRDEQQTALGITDDFEGARERLAKIDRALRPGHWDDFARDPLGELEFLDTKVAPLSGEGENMFLRYVGTDLQAFAKHFDRFQIVKGEMVPPGSRGLLINQRYADAQLKLKVARLFDDLRKGVDEEGKRIESDDALKAKARQLPTQHGIIMLMLGPKEAAELEPILRATLPGAEGDLESLVKAALTVDDETFAARDALFTKEIAPRVDLYPFEVGGVVTIQAFTRRGYVKAVNVKVWGTFQFAGLERSELSGAANLVDLVTFRELYGQMSTADREELAAMQKEVGTEALAREDAEAALFGGDDAVVQEVDTGGFQATDIARRVKRTVEARPFTQGELEQGLALNAAVVLRDASRLRETRQAILAAGEAAGLKWKVVDWRAASGVVGQFVLMVRVVLYIALFIIFAVALVIINNSMLMATLERVREIGTLRAIGAQRRFVMVMFLGETFVLALAAALSGALVAAGLVSWLGDVGIPAANDVMVFLFSGPRLHPTMALGHAVGATVVILFVGMVATLYPARLATRVSPLEAMRGAG